MLEGIREHLLLFATGDSESIDPEVAFDLASALKEVLSGETPDLFNIRRKRGDRSMRAAQISCVTDALSYIHWCSRGILSDPNPITTVSALYGVTERQVKNWQTAKEYRALRQFVPPDMPARVWIEKTIARLNFSAEDYKQLRSRKKCTHASR